MKLKRKMKYSQLKWEKVLTVNTASDIEKKKRLTVDEVPGNSKENIVESTRIYICFNRYTNAFDLG